MLSNASTCDGLWELCYNPSGYRINIPTRFPTLFEKYKKEEGCTIAYVQLRRTNKPAPERVAWRPRPN